MTYRLIFLFCCMLTQQLLYAQSKSDTILLQKGEILDVLLISANPDTKAELADYFKTVFPVGKRYSYQPLPGFRILEHVRGNIRPESLILGKWEDREQREAFLKDIVGEVPDFHQRRRTIWSYFGLCYFEMEEDVSIIIDRADFQVATALWFDAEVNHDKYLNKFKQQIAASGGSVLTALEDGISPFGYRYRPDKFIITSWPDEASYRAFQARESDAGLQHVNAFILQ